VAGGTEFADEEDVEGKVESASDLVAYRNSAAWQGKDDGLRPTAKMLQSFG